MPFGGTGVAKKETSVTFSSLENSSLKSLELRNFPFVCTPTFDVRFSK